MFRDPISLLRPRPPRSNIEKALNIIFEIVIDLFVFQGNAITIMTAEGGNNTRWLILRIRGPVCVCVCVRV